MAIILSTTREPVTVVHTTDTDVQAPEGREGFFPVSDCTAGPGATRIVVRGLAGHEMLSCWAAGDIGKQAVAVVTAAMQTIDGAKPTEAQILALDWQVLLHLCRFVENISTRPTVARPTA